MTNAVQSAAPPTIWDSLENWAHLLKGWQRLTLALAVKHGRLIVTGLRRIEWDNSLADDVVDLFEDLSKYLEGHTHSDEASGAPPEPKDLEGMIGRAEGLIRRAKSERPKPSRVRL